MGQRDGPGKLNWSYQDLVDARSPCYRNAGHVEDRLNHAGDPLIEIRDFTIQAELNRLRLEVLKRLNHVLETAGIAPIAMKDTN